MGEMKTLGRHGDIHVSWNTDNDKEVSTAKEMFYKKINEGWSAFREKLVGAKGDRIKEFDPEAQRIILVPPITGG